MHITRRIDRAFQWAGEKMGGDKTAHSDEFKNLETEMNLRHEGMEKLQKSANGYVKWISRRGESLEDKEKAVPIGYVGRMMVSHGEDFEPDSEFGTNLIALGRAHERIADIQGSYATDVTHNWLDSIDRSLAMMKEYQSARKKHESRRLAYDASISKQQKARREDYRIEEEMRANRAKFEESGEDVMRRMQDIKEAETDNVRDMSGFLDAELDYHERCAEELRRVRQAWTAVPAAAALPSPSSAVERTTTRRASESRPTVRSRTNTLRSFNDYSPRSSVVAEQPEPAPEPRETTTPPPQPTRVPFRTHRSESRVSFTTTESPSRPVATRAITIQSPPVYRPSSVAPTVAPVPVASARRAHTTHSSSRAEIAPGTSTGEDIFADDYDDSIASGGDGSRSGSPGWAERSASPATSFGSANSSTSHLARRAPPPPPCRSKKPPPVPPKRVVEVGY